MAVRILNEGIVHLEDLSIDKFIQTIKNIYKFYCSEKIDGANLWFGLDDSGKFFTTREQKGRDKDPKYTASDYNMVSAYNGFRSAHAALQSKVSIIKKHLKPGDMVEIEVLFGRQPNVVKYSTNDTNYIVLLRPVEGTSQDAFDSLTESLKNEETSVQTKIVDTIDGSTLQHTFSNFSWKFVRNVATKVSAQLISAKRLNPELKRLEDFLQQQNKEMSALAGKSLTNFEAMSIKLTAIQSSNRDNAKLIKESLREKIMIAFKLPIKQMLMSDLTRNGEFLSQKFGKDPKDAELEGYVLSDESGEMVKLVDRDLFTAVNEFNFRIRNELNGIVMSDDVEAPLEVRGGIFGTSKIRIASILGVPDLAKSSKARKVFKSYQEGSASDTINAFVRSLKISDFLQFKTKISAVLKDTLAELQTKLNTFNQECSSYKIKLKTGKVIGFTDEAKKRTHLAFAELKKEISELQSNVKKCKTLNEMIYVLYGRFIDEIFPKQKQISEGFKLELELMKKIVQEDEAGDASPNEAPEPAAITASAIAPVPLRMFNGKVLKRIKRNYFPKKKSHK